MIGDSLRGGGAVIGTGTGGFSVTLTATLSAVGGWAAGAWVWALSKPDTVTG
jgi:hypothetical protein